MQDYKYKDPVSGQVFSYGDPTLNREAIQGQKLQYVSGGTGDPLAGFRVNSTNPGTPGTAAKSSSTVLSNANVIENTIPKLTTSLNNLSSKGTYVDAQGTQRYSDGSLVPPPSDAVAGENGYISGGLNYASPDSDTSFYDKKQNDLLEQMKASLDATTKAQIDAIQQKFAVRRAQQEDINTRQKKGVEQTLLLGGAARYSPLSAEGTVSTQERYGIQELSELDAQEQDLINSAKAAQQSGNFKIMEKQLDLAEKKRVEKVAAAQKLNESIAEENKKQRESLAASAKDVAISSVIASGITDPVSIVKKLKEQGYSDITFDNVADITDRVKKYELDFPGITGELLSAKANGLVPPETTLEDFAFVKDPTKALDIRKTQLEIEKIKKDLNDKGISEDPANILAYAQQYASTGKIPTGIPKGTFGVISETAKSLPKAQGTLIDRTTGVTPSTLSATQIDGITALYDISKKIEDLEKLNKERVGGLVGAAFGKLTGSGDQLRYLEARKEIIDLLARARTGAALTASEEKFYTDQLPGRVGEAFIVGADPKIKIASFKKKINESLATKLSVNNASIYGYSKVKISGKDYTIGDIVTNADGQAGRVNSDGTITLIE